MIFNRQKKIAFSSAVISLIAGGILALIMLKPGIEGSAHLSQTSLAFILSGLISILAFYHASLSAKVEIEARDLENRPPEENIFGDDEDNEFMGNQARALHSFRKFITPIALILLSIIEFGAALYLMQFQVSGDLKLDDTIASSSLMHSFIMIAFAFACFAGGKYLAGLSYGEKATLLRPTAGRLLYAAFVALIAAVSSFAARYGYFEWLNYSNILLVTLGFILSLERVLLWVLDLYRPREANTTEAPVYESRLLSIFTRPSGVLSNLSDTLEYQFGFRISEQVLKSFCFKILLPFLTLQGVLLICFSALCYIQPGHMGLVSGSGQVQVKPPGFYIIKPWPFTKVTRISTKKTHKLNFTMGKDLRSPELIEEEGPFLEDKSWSNTQYEQAVFMTGGSAQSPASLIVFNADLQFNIGDEPEQVLAWSSHQNPTETLKSLSQQALMKSLLNSSFLELYKMPRYDLAQSLKKAIQVSAEKTLGITVNDLQIINFQPHPAIADAWHEQLAAYEDQKRIRDEAITYQAVNTHKARGEDSDIRNQSQSNYLMKSMIAEADREIFQTRLNAFLKYDDLYTQFEMIEALTTHLQGIRKFVFTKRQKKITTLDLKKPQPSILDISE